MQAIYPAIYQTHLEDDEWDWEMMTTYLADGACSILGRTVWTKPRDPGRHQSKRESEPISGVGGAATANPGS